MKHQSTRNPVGFVVTLKMNNTVSELLRNNKDQVKVYAHMRTAINAVKKLRAGYQGEGEWVAMTTIRLADIHRKEWDKAGV
jgi:hypothetical protein